MICIYLLSVLFSFILGGNGIIPGNTTALIIIQSAGIILFYVEIFFFRDRLVHFIGYIRRETTAEKKKIVLLGILGLALLVVGTVVVILLLIAILMPGFTLVNFINVYEFVRERSNFWILIILISQMVFMLCLQSLLSRRITLGMCDDMIDQLRSARADLQSGIHSIANTGISGTDQNEIRQMRNTLKILKETGLYAFNRRPMFGIFPIYSVGISLPALFEIESLSDLEDIFFFEK